MFASIVGSTDGYSTEEGTFCSLCGRGPRQKGQNNRLRETRGSFFGEAIEADVGMKASEDAQTSSDQEPADATNRTTLNMVESEEPLDLGSHPEDPLLADLVSLNETTVRLRNAIAGAEKRGTLPLRRLSDYLAQSEEAPQILMRGVENLGRKSAVELDSLIQRVRQRAERPLPEQRNYSVDDLRSALSGLFETTSVSEIMETHDFPVRLRTALTYAGYAEKPISELLKAFAELEPELLKLPNLGRRSVVVGRKILREIVVEGLTRRGFSLHEAQDADALLVGRSDLYRAKRAILAERLERVTSDPLPQSPPGRVEGDEPDEVALEPSTPALSPEMLLSALLGDQKDRTKDIIARRFGLRQPEQTLEEVGQHYKITRERVRQIEAKTIGLLRQRGKRRLTTAIFEHGQSVWDALSGGEILILAADLPTFRTRLSPWFLLALEIVGLRLDEWLDRFSKRVDGGWVSNNFPSERLEPLREALTRSLADTPLPCAISTFTEPQAAAETQAVVRLMGLTLYGDYVVAERPRQRVRRALGLHAILGDGGVLPLKQLMAIYWTRAPGDVCSFRDAEIVMQAQRHLFVELVDGVWAAVGRAGSAPGASKDEPPETVAGEEPDANVSTETQADGTIGAAIEAELRHFGPLRISELTDRADAFLPPGRSANSLGPILLTNKDRFVRPLPAFYALPDQIPPPEQLLKTPPAFIFQLDQVLFYTLGRRAGEAWGTFPLWIPETEYLWCVWARQHAEPVLLEALLSVIDLDAWPEEAHDRENWRALAKSRGRFLIHYPPNLESVALPELERLFAACLYVRHFGQLGWISANRMLWRRVTDHSAAGLIALLVALNALEPAADWQLPHLAGPRLPMIIDRLCEERWRIGHLSWGSAAGQALCQEALASRRSSMGWVEPTFLQRMLTVVSEPIPPVQAKSVDPLQLLLAEQADAKRSTAVEAALRSLAAQHERGL